MISSPPPIATSLKGVGLRYGWAGLARSPLSKLNLVLASDSVPQFNVLLQQDCYTPASIRRRVPDPDDRPFAAALCLAQEARSYDAIRGIELLSRFSLGVIGPCAFCAEEQRWIHNGLGNIEPLGWENQLGASLLLNYHARLTKQLLSRKTFALLGGVGTALGTYQDHLDGELTLRIGDAASDFRNRGFRWMLFGKAGARFVAYDAALQGRLFRNDDAFALPAASIDRTIGNLQWGVRLRFGTVELSYTETYLTRAFTGGLPHGWGSFGIAFRY